MSLRETVERRLVNDYVREHGMPAIGRARAGDIARNLTGNLDWFPVAEFGSTDYYELYADFVEELEYASGVLA